MKSVLVLLASVTFAIAPFLSNEFGGFDPERFPVPQQNPPVQPVGWAFAIWGLIYPLLLCHAIFGWKQYSQHEQWERGRLPLFLSLAVGTFWLAVAARSPIWASLLIVVMLGGALLALYRTRHASPAWIAVWPVSLYAGWLSAATFVSVGLLLAGYGLTSEVTAAIIGLAGATALSIVVQLRLAQWPYAAAVSWGFTGISIANLGKHDLIAIGASLSAVTLMAIAIFQLKRNGQTPSSAQQ